jgi:hypothetical protein
MVWSADFVADDWTHISADEVMKRALERLERDSVAIVGDVAERHIAPGREIGGTGDAGPDFTPDGRA